MCGFYLSSVRSVHHIYIFRTLHSFELLIKAVLYEVCPFSVRSVHQHPVFRTKLCLKYHFFLTLYIINSIIPIYGFALISRYVSFFAICSICIEKGEYNLKSQIIFLYNELSLIEELISYLEFNHSFIDGNLKPEKRGNYTYYYCHIKGEQNRRYLGKPNSAKVKQFAADLIAGQLSTDLSNDRLAIENCLNSLSSCSLDSLKGSLLSKYPDIDVDLFFDDRLRELYDWASDDYEKNKSEFPPGDNITCDGTKVRSKGESLWYNALKKAGIPFRYDSVILLYDKDGKPVYKSPDFLIQCYDGTFIIIEHLGLLLDDRYNESFNNKFQLYLSSKYVLGSNLFLTSDDACNCTDSLAIERILEIVKKRFLDGAPAYVKLLIN